MKTRSLYVLTFATTLLFWGCGGTGGGQSVAGVEPDGSTTARLDADGDSASEDSNEDPENGASKPGDEIESMYTDISFDKCKKIEEELIDGVPYSSVYLCEGVGGYKLELPDVDLRQTVNIVYPDGKKHELRFGRVVSSSFSETGKKAEWRVVKENGKIRPVALIVRFIVSVADARPEDPPPDLSFLTVSKITVDLACVTDAVGPGKDQNVKARQLADSSASRPCRTKEVSIGDYIDGL